ncbi:hypothetical protein CA233_14825 [Sphingomonas sp. ABOLD]|uniref:Uncharacterized protein n=1 Tax=Sphingomonas trueperi TaxID=53317 RepID=A0A7X5Y0N5_9SPHN|nr:MULTISPECIES: hypothetical protein [Sphingomonas]NJB98455.1 hypothetical protein [Sphingomonas trueperi]RSV45274.1 hypothetical protein CA233_14825 [Sphingomonas sp. ABOLD]
MSTNYPKPAVRRLKVYAFDPQASVTLATAMANDYVIELPWEQRWEAPLEKGPVNDYVEVIDIDPAAGLFYAPVDLDDPWLRDGGLEPSEGRPQFHQQMVFAVVMRTIRAFERALGRVVLWARDERLSSAELPPGAIERNFTRRLRIYPHALREANAYYSPDKRALLFGYFKPPESAADVQASWVFTCLSQDVIAHETTHAILHGMRQRSIDPSHVDARAFHEGFADIVALLQHFSMAPVVRQLLAASHGSLREPGLLTGLGEQFGRAIGRSKSLRYALEALGDRARTHQGSAESIAAAIAKLRETTEPHARGGFLVAAVFDAFVTIYERRSEDLLRLARPGLVPGNGLSPDLVGRLTQEAAKAADQVLRMCVRALDYLPPIGMTFGEYLRAIITADTDLVRDDPLHYRVAFVEAFKRWGITVPGCISMAPDSLLWDSPRPEEYPALIARANGTPEGEAPPQARMDPDDALAWWFADMLKRLQFDVAFDQADDGLGERSAESEEQASSGKVTYTRRDYRSGPAGGRNLRDLAMRVVTQNQRAIHQWLEQCTTDRHDWERLLGVKLTPACARVADVNAPAALRSISGGTDPGAVPNVEVHSARISRRTGPDGSEMHMLIAQIVQRRRAYFDPEEQKAADSGDKGVIGALRWKTPDFWFRGGATLHIDLRDGRLLRVLRKRIDDDARLARERAFRSGDMIAATAAVTGNPREPFAFIHRGS